MDDVELVVELRDHAFVGWAGIDVGDVVRPWLAPAAEGGALPVLAALPDEPFAVRVVAEQLVGAQRHRRIEGELAGFGLLLEDMLRHHPHRVPPHGEQRVEARVRLLQLEHHGVAVGRGDLGDVDLDGRAPTQALRVHVGLDGVDHVIGGEFDAVAPVDAAAQLHGHLGEVGVVDWLLGCQRVFPDAIDALVRIDVPERVHAELMQAVGLAAGVDRPDVEPAGVLDGAFGVLGDQRFVAWQLVDGALGVEGPAGQAGRGGQHKPSQDAHSFPPALVLLVGGER